MCGIVGCVGVSDAHRFLLDGLKLLEYRGYDSAGIALVHDGELQIFRAVGMVNMLEAKCAGNLHQSATTGIAHTRWATHGGVTEVNAHPHTDASGEIAIVHNGIVENHIPLRKLLESEGSVFKSETDTEIIAHLIAHFYEDDLAEAVRQAVLELRGTFGVVVCSTREPDTIVAVRMGSPLVMGIGDGSYMFASDVPALLSRTNRVIYLNDGEVVKVTPEGYEISSLDRREVTPKVEELDQKLESIELGDFPHYMLKEIFDQPLALTNTMRGRVRPTQNDVVLNGALLTVDEISNLRRIIMVGCGTSWHAGIVGKYIIEELVRIPVEVEYASELRYRNPIVRRKEDLYIFITQSGETLDTLAALKELRRKGARTLGICNVVNSTIAREVESGIYTHAGIEIGVASTKAFTSQVVTLILLALHIGRSRDMASYLVAEIIENLERVPGVIQNMLTEENLEPIRKIARSVVDRDTKNFLYLGRGANFPVALEGALKMKEISYIHAEGYPAAEMKHGPIALIDEDMPVVVIAPRDRGYDKIKNNIDELLARGAKIIAITTEDNDELDGTVEHVIKVPKMISPVMPLLTVIPLQLLAYYVACMKGLSVDKPRNLAKSVTVE